MLKAMTLEEKQAIMALCERQSDSLQSETMGDDNADFGDDNPDFGAFDNILSGAHPLQISHAGGEFQEMARQVLNAMRTKYISPLTFAMKLILDHRLFVSRQSHRDYRTRRDRARLWAIAFEQQIPAVAEAYLTWCFNHSQQGRRGFFKEFTDSSACNTDNCTGQVTLNVIDIFRK